MTTDTDSADLAACEQALRELVTAIVDHDASRLPRSSGSIKATPFRMVPIESLTLDRIAVKEILADPVRGALRQAVRRMGRELYRLKGSTDAMIFSYDKVADMDDDEAKGARRAAIMDSAWNGIGEGDDRWWS